MPNRLLNKDSRISYPPWRSCSPTSWGGPARVRVGLPGPGRRHAHRLARLALRILPGRPRRPRHPECLGALTWSETLETWTCAVT